MTRFGLCAVAFAAALPAVLGAAPALAAPQCVEMQFLDANGVVVPANPPLIGIIIGSAPLYEGVTPAGAASAKGGRLLPCPEALVASTQKTFDDFCTSDQRRQNAATANNADIALINKRCADLSLTLAK